MTSEICSRGQAFLAQGTDQFKKKMLSIRKVRLLITSRYIAMQSYECVIISQMFLIYFLSYGCNGGALVFLGGAEASASPSFALPMFITIKKKKNSASVFRCASCHCGWHRHTLAHPWLRPWYWTPACRQNKSFLVLGLKMMKIQEIKKIYFFKCIHLFIILFEN